LLWHLLQSWLLTDPQGLLLHPCQHFQESKYMCP
jgi:hypothetical protein